MQKKKRRIKTGRSVSACLVALALVLAGAFAAPEWVYAAKADEEPKKPAAAAVTGGKWRTTQQKGKTGERRQVPILLYHNLTEDPKSPDISTNTISLKQFEEEIKLLSSLGCTAVSFDQMIDFVEKGTPLPKKPVCITFDDGYLSNYELALPVLKKHKMKATIFVIGSSVGSKEYYKDTKFPITPHFDFQQAKEMSDTGLVSIQTHTYDMHQWKEYETGDRVRSNVLRLDDESEDAYASALEADFTRARDEIEAVTGKPVNVLAYPAGISDDLSQRLLESFGVKATLSITPGKATLIRGVPKSLRAMNRCYVTPSTTLETFRKWIS